METSFARPPYGGEWKKTWISPALRIDTDKSGENGVRVGFPFLTWLAPPHRTTPQNPL